MKIQRRPLGEQVTALIREMIHQGELAPGQRLVEEQLAEQTGTSRTPIREALHRLEQEGLVVRRDKGGYRVRPLSAREVEETTGVRAALESYAVELACRAMTPERLEGLKQNVAEFAQALQAGQRQRLVELNTQFHQELYQMAGSQLLLRMINDLAEALHRFRVALLSDPESAARSLRDHRAMLEALEKGDPHLAARACREHVLAGGRWMLERLPQQDNEE